ncbi:unnamed protein product, partial [marine sediment metagenome]
AVWAPFGDKLLQGIVLELTDYPSVEETTTTALNKGSPSPPIKK